MKNDPAQAGTMPFLSHFAELRKRFIISFAAALLGTIVCFFLYDWIVELLFKPFDAISEQAIVNENTLFISTLFEGFFTRLKVSFVSGIILSFPCHIYQIVRFIFPGLKKGEKKVIIGVLVASSLLLPLGFYYGYNFIIPLSVRFLTGAGFVPQNVGILLNYGKNIFIITQFLLAFMIIFQMPIVLILIMKLNIVSRKTLFSAGRYIIVGIFVLSAILTPPDFISQVSVALPLIVLYFLSLGIAKICNFGAGDV